MHYDPFKVEVITETKTTTLQKLLTAILLVYFSAAFSAVVMSLYFLLQKES